jgi:hypothetical protein
MVQTPVGVRCRTCAQLKRLPQFDVGAGLLLRSGGAGLVVSLLAWLVIAFVPFLSFFLAILVGVAVGEVMSRLARRRSSRALDVTAVLVVVIGLLAAYTALGGLSTVTQGLLDSPGFIIRLLVPAAIASFVAVLKLR